VVYKRWNIYFLDSLIHLLLEICSLYLFKVTVAIRGVGWKLIIALFLILGFPVYIHSSNSLSSFQTHFLCNQALSYCIIMPSASVLFHLHKSMHTEQSAGWVNL